MAKASLSIRSLQEIFKKMIGAEGKGELPSPTLIKELAKSTGVNEATVKGKFKDEYQKITQTDEDPFMTPPPTLG